jgi:peptidoglycan/xylan/chitin deacetylase (PgdA/CDA1 family)
MIGESTMATPIPVFLYHSVAEDDNAYTVAPAEFAAHLALIADSGRTPLTLTELSLALRGERAMPDAAVCLTFDDGYADSRATIESAVAMGVKATLFVTTGAVDSPGSVTRADLVSLAAMRGQVELGAHSVTHARLDEIRSADALREITVSRAALAETIGQQVRSFAYPYGSHSSRVRKLVIDAGFDAAAGVKNALSHTEDDAWAIARVTVTRATSRSLMAMLLHGAGAPLAWRRERLGTRAYRLERIATRRLAEIGSDR